MGAEDITNPVSSIPERNLCDCPNTASTAAVYVAYGRKATLFTFALYTKFLDEDE